MKALLAVDGSTYTQRMLDYLAGHPALLGDAAELTALTVVPAVPSYAARFLNQSDIDSYHAEQAKSVLDPVRKFAADHAWHLQARQAVGHAADEIVRAAQAEAFDLIVIGTHGHSALGGVVMGSVATKVVAATRTPVLLLR